MAKLALVLLPAAAATSIQGFWFGYAGSTSPDPAPTSGWFFSFPGSAVSPPFTPKEYTKIQPPPSWGSYEKKILTQGGGKTSWGDAFYSQLTDQLSEYKPAGWDGVCWDWETTASDHTYAGFNALMKATKAAGLLNIVTSTAEGPYKWGAKSLDATDIDWSQVDYFVPQIYGADGKLSDPAWPEYAQYWVDGAGKPNVHGVTFPPVPMEKILWGMPAGECDQATMYGGSGCVEWAYSPNVKPGAVQV
jgi:hypothetical protein